EGVDLDRGSPRLLLAAALRAWTLVAAAAGARLADHGSILPAAAPAACAGDMHRDRFSKCRSSRRRASFRGLPSRRRRRSPRPPPRDWTSESAPEPISAIDPAARPAPTAIAASRTW